MAYFKIFKGTQAEVNAQAIIDGQLLYTTDLGTDNKIYADVVSTRTTLANGVGVDLTDFEALETIVNGHTTDISDLNTSLNVLDTSLNVVEDDLASLTNWELLASSTSTATTTKVVNNLNDYKLIIGICVFTSTNVFYTPTILPLALFKIGGNNACMINAISGSSVLSGRFEYLSDTSVSIAAASASAEIRLYGVK